MLEYFSGRDPLDYTSNNMVEGHPYTMKLLNGSWTTNKTHTLLHRKLGGNIAVAPTGDVYLSVIISCPKIHKISSPVRISGITAPFGHVGFCIWNGDLSGKQELCGILTNGEIDKELFSYEQFSTSSVMDIHFYTTSISINQAANVMTRLNAINGDISEESRYSEFTSNRYRRNMPNKSYNCITFVDDLLCAANLSNYGVGKIAAMTTPSIYSKSFRGPHGWWFSYIPGARHI